MTHLDHRPASHVAVAKQVSAFIKAPVRVDTMPSLKARVDVRRRGIFRGPEYSGMACGGAGAAAGTPIANGASQCDGDLTLYRFVRGPIGLGSAADARSAVMRSRRRSTGRWGRGQSALPIAAPQLSFGDVLAGVRFAAFPRTDLAGLRALPRVAALLLRAAARFFR